MNYSKLRKELLVDGPPENTLIISPPILVDVFVLERSQGDLPFMLTWQSLDGRPESRFFNDFFEASQQAGSLYSLGRESQLWIRDCKFLKRKERAHN